MGLLSHFSSDSGEAHGKSLFEILSTHGRENGERVWHAWLTELSRGNTLPHTKSNTYKNKSTHALSSLFHSVYLAVIYRRPLG